MRLDALLARCRRFEERAAALYRSYAARSRAEPTLCALWTALAREEEAHAEAIARAQARREATTGWRTRLDGWEEALVRVDGCLGAAERLGAEAPTEHHLSAALELEMTELDALREVLLSTCGEPDPGAPDDHAMRLAEAAEGLTDDPQVRLQAALVRARARVSGHE